MSALRILGGLASGLGQGMQLQHQEATRREESDVAHRREQALAALRHQQSLEAATHSADLTDRNAGRHAIRTDFYDERDDRRTAGYQIDQIDRTNMWAGQRQERGIAADIAKDERDFQQSLTMEEIQQRNRVALANLGNSHQLTQQQNASRLRIEEQSTRDGLAIERWEVGADGSMIGYRNNGTFIRSAPGQHQVGEGESAGGTLAGRRGRQGGAAPGSSPNSPAPATRQTAQATSTAATLGQPTGQQAAAVDYLVRAYDEATPQSMPQWFTADGRRRPMNEIAADIRRRVPE